MVTGYERQHRKGFNYIPCEGADTQTTDQYTRLITHAANIGDVHEQFSRACEQACITGLVLLQPYLDFNADDHAQGQLKLKLWEYNSFLVVPYFRNFDMSDAQFVWCQEYISKKEAEFRFPDKLQNIAPMAGTPQRYGSFYFLPENYNMARNDLMVLSYVWYKWKRKKKRLYSEQRNQFFDFAGNQNELDQLLYNIPDMKEVNVEVPTWKLAVVLNDQLMFQGDNPLGFDDCPFIPVFWNYEPHINYYDLRCRGLVRTMRDSNYLLNRRIIINHDISEATINMGWKRKVGAVANEDNLKKSGQGWDVIINEGYEMTDFERIQPAAVPESDFALADQLRSLIFATSGVDLENWSAQNEKQSSTLTTLIKQAANLMVLQKYFDQWDQAKKLVGERLLQIALNNWNAQKVGLMIGEEPSPFFYSKIFSKFQVIVEEGELTPTQQNMQAQSLMDINAAFGREVFPPSMIVPHMNITGKAEAIQFLQQQEQQMQAVQAEATNIQHAFEEAKLRELYAKAANSIAAAKERYGRFESNIGLLEERMAEVSKNRALSTKAKMEALEKMVDVIGKYGEIETALKMNDIQSLEVQDRAMEETDKRSAHQEAVSNEFLAKLMNGNQPLAQQQTNM
ncbi:MAG TPA: hypothetical protein DCP92_24740 [Nitrospiraceae bacterium]|nr:hypothetical protein [Nitrospiraceae bacterium]